MPNIIQWRNQNSEIKYPFHEESSMSLGAGTLDLDAILDIQLFCGLQGPVFISRILLNGDGSLSIYFSTKAEASFAVAIVDISKEIPQEIAITSTSLSNVRMGTIYLGAEFKRITSVIPSSSVTLKDGDLVLLDSCVFYYKKSACVSSIECNGLKNSKRVYFIEGDGIELETAGSVIIIHANGRGSRDLCSTALLNIDFVKAINNNPPNSYGNFLIEPLAISEPSSINDMKQALKIEPISNGIKVSLVG